MLNSVLNLPDKTSGFSVSISEVKIPLYSEAIWLNGKKIESDISYEFKTLLKRTNNR